MNQTLKNYIEEQILPRYDGLDKAHDINHVNTVIEQSLELAPHFDVDIDMVYVIAAYHDLGIVNGRENHHVDSGKILVADTRLIEWFTQSQIETMRDAVEDHRASSDHTPRTIYGMIVSQADRVIVPKVVITRTILFGLDHYPELEKDKQFLRFREHLLEKYAEGGYLKLWLPYGNNAKNLEILRKLIADEHELRSQFDDIYSSLIQSRSDGSAQN